MPIDRNPTIYVVTPSELPRALRLTHELLALGWKVKIADTPERGAEAGRAGYCIIVLTKNGWRDPALVEAIKRRPDILIPVLAERMTLPSGPWTTDPIEMRAPISESAQLVADMLDSLWGRLPATRQSSRPRSDDPSTFSTIGSSRTPSRPYSYDNLETRTPSRPYSYDNLETHTPSRPYSYDNLETRTPSRPRESIDEFSSSRPRASYDDFPPSGTHNSSSHTIVLHGDNALYDQISGQMSNKSHAVDSVQPLAKRKSSTMRFLIGTLVLLTLIVAGLSTKDVLENPSTLSINGITLGATSSNANPQAMSTPTLASTHQPTPWPTLVNNPTPTPMGSPASSSTARCSTNVTFVNGQFLKSNGTNMLYNGTPVCLYGATIFTVGGKGTDPSCGNPVDLAWNNPAFTKEIDWDLCMAQLTRLNSIRVTTYVDNASEDPYNRVVWKNIDYLIAQAQKKGLFIFLDFASFAIHLENLNINPYDIAQDPLWRQFLTFAITRVNTYTNVAYKDTPNIANYSIRGEVNPVGGAFPSCPTSQCYLDFYTRTTTEVFNADGGNHLVIAGGLIHLDYNSGIPWQQIFSLPHVDIAAIHDYPPSYCPISQLETCDTGLAISLPMIGKWAQQNKKIAILEEYGFANSLGDQIRAQEMQITINATVKYGYQGIIYWNLGPETDIGQHYEVNPSFPLAWQALINGAALFSGTP